MGDQIKKTEKELVLKHFWKRGADEANFKNGLLFDIYIKDNESGTEYPAENITKEQYLKVAREDIGNSIEYFKILLNKPNADEKYKKDLLVFIKFYNYLLENEQKLVERWTKTPKPIAEDKRGEQKKLFANSIDTDGAFGINRNFADKYKGILDEITPEAVKENYKYHGKTFKGKKNNLALRVIDDENLISNAKQFYKRLEKIKSGKTLQTLLALWAYTNKQGNFIFSGTRLSKIMQTILKTKNGYFTQPQKKEFTEAIHRLRDFEIYLDQTITDTNDKGRKKQMIKRDFHKLIDLVGATYAKRKQDMVDKETGRVIFKKGEADETVIVKLYGELLPRFNKGIMRGRLYSRGLLKLDANKDERAILLGFKLLTRFDQIRMGARGKDLVPDENLYITVDRKTLIKWADYKQTDEINKGIANQHLTKTLKKLINIKCLRAFEPEKLTTKDDLQIILYPHPIALKLPNNDNNPKIKLLKI